MRVYVINLKKNKQRMIEISQSLKLAGVAYERLTAVYGKELPEDVKARSVNRFRWWCTQGYRIRDGQLGCALSHQLVYRKLLSGGDKCCCVMEDDAKIYDYYAEQLQRVETWISEEEPQVILLANHSEAECKEWVIRPTKDSFAEGYVINRRAAEMILKVNFPIAMPADAWKYWQKRGVLRVYHAFPSVCNQQWQDEGYKSDVSPDGGFNYRILPWWGRLLWKCKRVVGRTIDFLLPLK